MSFVKSKVMPELVSSVTNWTTTLAIQRLVLRVKDNSGCHPRWCNATWFINHSPFLSCCIYWKAEQQLRIYKKRVFLYCTSAIYPESAEIDAFQVESCILFCLLGDGDRATYPVSA